MVSASPWSVKGVEPEAREAAKIAARRAGMTLGQWLNQTIRRSAAQELAGPERTSQEVAPYDPAANDGPKDDGRNGSGQPGDGSGVRAHPPAPTAEAIFESIRRLTTRIEESETKTRATVEPLETRVRQLSEQVEQVRAQTACSTAPVERAILRLSERLERIETPRKAANGERGWSIFGRGG